MEKNPPFPSVKEKQLGDAKMVSVCGTERTGWGQPLAWTAALTAGNVTAAASHGRSSCDFCCRTREEAALSCTALCLPAQK